MALRYIHNNGLPSDDCVSYKSGDGITRTCPTYCDDGSDITLTHGPSDPTMVCTGENWLMEAIYEKGPVVT